MVECFLFDCDGSGTYSGDVSTKQDPFVEYHMVIHNIISITEQAA